MRPDKKFFRAMEESAARVRLVWGGATWPECLVQEWKLETGREHSTEKLGFFHEQPTNRLWNFRGPVSWTMVV